MHTCPCSVGTEVCKCANGRAAGICYLCTPSSVSDILFHLCVSASAPQGSTESVDGSCKDCRNEEESGSCGEVTATPEDSSCSCPAVSLLGSPKVKKGRSLTRALGNVVVPDVQKSELWFLFPM